MKNKICGGIFCQNYEKKYSCSLCYCNFCKICIVEENKKYFCLDCYAGLYIIDILGLKNKKGDNKVNIAEIV